MHFAACVRVTYANSPTATGEAYAAISSSIEALRGQMHFSKLSPILPGFIYDLFDTSLAVFVDGLCDQNTFTMLHRQMRLRDQDRVVRRYWSSGKAAASVFVISDPEKIKSARQREAILRTICDGDGWHIGKWIDGFSASRFTAQERSALVADHLVKNFQSEMIRRADVPKQPVNKSRTRSLDENNGASRVGFGRPEMVVPRSVCIGA